MCALGPGPGNYNYIAGAPHFYYLFIVIAYVNTLAALLFIVGAVLIHTAQQAPLETCLIFIFNCFNKFMCWLGSILERRACNSLSYVLGAYFFF